PGRGRHQMVERARKFFLRLHLVKGLDPGIDAVAHGIGKISEERPPVWPLVLVHSNTGNMHRLHQATSPADVQYARPASRAPPRRRSPSIARKGTGAGAGFRGRPSTSGRDGARGPVSIETLLHLVEPPVGDLQQSFGAVSVVGVG